LVSLVEVIIQNGKSMLAATIMPEVK